MKDIQWNPSFFNCLGNNKLIPIIGRFEKSGLNDSVWLVNRSYVWFELSRILKNGGFKTSGFYCNVRSYCWKFLLILGYPLWCREINKISYTYQDYVGALFQFGDGVLMCFICTVFSSGSTPNCTNSYALCAGKSGNSRNNNTKKVV